MKRPQGITTRTPTAEPQPQMQMRYDFSGDARMLLSQTMNILKQDLPAAVVILERSLLFNISPQDAVARNFQGFVRDTLAQLPRDNRNILVFSESTENLMDLSSRFREIGLEDLFFHTENANAAGKAGLAHIGPPGRDECRRLFSRLRVVDKKKVHLPDADAMGLLAASWARENNAGLHWLATRLQSLDELNLPQLEGALGKKSEKTAQELLDDMVGMESLKEQLALEISVLKRPQFQKPAPAAYPARLGAEGRKDSPPYLNHFALLGNPGTGKTTVARIIGKLLQEKGLLETGHFIGVTRSDLVGEYVGSTAIKTRQVLERAMGGVLFIDEAYSLHQENQDSFGQECITTLIEAMESQRGRFVLILAGYPNEMRKMIDSNPGFQRRLKEIRIPDYTDEQLAEIMRRMLRNELCEPQLLETIPGYVKNLLGNRSVNADWGNAGEIQRICEDARRRRDARGGDFLTRGDFEHPEYFAQEERNKEQTLDDLIGMQELKDNLKKLLASLKYKKQRGEKVEIGHYFFVGNPGTGKTTAANMMARELYRRGLLQTPRCVIHTASDFIGRYLGESENKTREIFEKALNGVLFIDEAHQFVEERTLQGGWSSSYGARVLETLVPLMENHRHEISVVFAGYTRQMKRLLEFDPGMKSRIKNIIAFEDYTSGELLQIFLKMFQNEFPDQAFPELLHPQILDFFEKVRAHEGEKFGNARVVRNFVESLAGHMMQRWDEFPDSGAGVLEEDLEKAIRDYKFL